MLESYTEARSIVEQKLPPDGELDFRFSMEITPDQDSIKLVLNSRVGHPQVIYMTLETADALCEGLVAMVDQLEAYVDRDIKYYMPKEPEE